MDRTELYLKTAFCCMACDGEIVPEEMEKINTLSYFKGLDIHQFLSDYLSQLKKEGSVFLKKYLDEVKNSNLTELEECELTNIAIQTIEVDRTIEYKEVAFFKKLRKRLKATDEVLLTTIPQNPNVEDQISPEDYLLPDITDENDLTLWTDAFSNVNVIV